MDDDVRKNITDRLREGVPGTEESDAVADVAQLRGRGSDLEQLHAKLVPPASDSLARLVHLTRLSKTDVVNRALQVYCFIEEQKLQGGELLVRKHDELQQVHII
jgi:hypothetical protein